MYVIHTYYRYIHIIDVHVHVYLWVRGAGTACRALGVAMHIVAKNLYIYTFTHKHTHTQTHTQIESVHTHTPGAAGSWSAKREARSSAERKSSTTHNMLLRWVSVSSGLLSSPATTFSFLPSPPTSSFLSVFSSGEAIASWASSCRMMHTSIGTDSTTSPCSNACWAKSPRPSAPVFRSALHMTEYCSASVRSSLPCAVRTHGRGGQARARAQ